MNNTVEHTKQEFVIIKQAGIIAGVMGIASAVLPAVDMAENGISILSCVGFILSFLAFTPFSVVCGIQWERKWGKSELNIPLVRLLVLTFCGFVVALALFSLLWLVSAKVIGAIIILIALIIGWMLWPSLPTNLVTVSQCRSETEPVSTE